VTRVSHGIDRVAVVFDDESLVANAGLVLVATLVARLGLEALVNSTVVLAARVGGARPGRKVLTLVHAMVAGASHIDHADMLRSGASGAVLGHQVMAPSTLGTFLRAFTFGHVRQLEAVIAVTIERAWAAGAGPGAKRLVVDIDSTICEVAGKAKHGAAYGYTKVLGYHPLLATDRAARPSRQPLRHPDLADAHLLAVGGTLHRPYWPRCGSWNRRPDNRWRHGAPPTYPGADNHSHTTSRPDQPRPNTVNIEPIRTPQPKAPRKDPPPRYRLRIGASRLNYRLITSPAVASRT
jgi:hypothetical protein